MKPKKYFLPLERALKNVGEQLFKLLKKLRPIQRYWPLNVWRKWRHRRFYAIL